MPRPRGRPGVRDTHVGAASSAPKVVPQTVMPPTPCVEGITVKLSLSPHPVLVRVLLEALVEDGNERQFPNWEISSLARVLYARSAWARQRHGIWRTGGHRQASA